MMELAQLKNILEAILLTADHPMDLRKLEALFEAEEDERPSRDMILQALQALQEDYQGRGIELREVASGYRMQVVPDCAQWVSRMWEEKAPRYSRALLETLVLIAYRQPITRGEIEEIRGVSVSSHIIKTLSEREWVRVLGHKDVPGKPAMYGTTREFLDYFNLKSLDDLPSLADIKDLDKLHPELALEAEVPAEGEDKPAAETTGESAEGEGEAVDNVEQPIVAEAEGADAEGDAVAEPGAGAEVEAATDTEEATLSETEVENTSEAEIASDDTDSDAADMPEQGMQASAEEAEMPQDEPAEASLEPVEDSLEMEEADANSDENPQNKPEIAAETVTE